MTNFFKKIVGKPLVGGAGMLYGDAIRAKRISNSLKLKEKYNLVKLDETQLTDLGFGYRLLEKASQEEDENIVTKWANLLGNTTHKKISGSIRRFFIETLETLESFDPKLFDDINKFCLSQATKYDTMVSLNNSAFSQRESLNVLLSLGLITYGVSVTEGVMVGGHASTTFHGLDSFKVTEMGQSFYKFVTR